MSKTNVNRPSSTDETSIDMDDLPPLVIISLLDLMTDPAAQALSKRLLAAGYEVHPS